MVSFEGRIHKVQGKLDWEIIGLLSEEMANQLIKVMKAGSSKLRMAQIRGWVTKGWGEEVEDTMVRFGWQREN